VDTVEELLLIKNWDKEVLYGTPPGEKTDEPITGIANLLTTWGRGLVNPNSASTNVLRSLPISDSKIEFIIEGQNGPDGEAGTADDGFKQEDLAALGADAAFFTLEPDYVKVTAIGKVGDVQSQISCIFANLKLVQKAAVPLFWLEGKSSE
jgi:hypothetical protein